VSSCCPFAGKGASVSDRTPARRGKGVGRGGPRRGYSWPPFTEGHTLSTRHGSYSVVHLQPRAQEVADWLRVALGDDYELRFEGAIAGAAEIRARVERAMAALETASPQDFARLEADARGWERLWFKALDALGLTPAAAKKLGLDSARSRRETKLADYLAAKYGAVEGEVEEVDEA